MLGERTKFYTDVKSKIMAGTKQGVIKVVGDEVTRIYFDTIEKDWQVGSEKIKRVIK